MNDADRCHAGSRSGGVSVRVLGLVLAVIISVSLLTTAPAYSSHNGVSISALAIDPSTPSILYAATPGGVFKSTNGGASWSASGLSSVSSLVIDPLTPTTLYAGSGGVFKSTDGGATWNPTVGLFATWSPWAQAGAVSTLAIDPQTPTTIYAGTLGSPIDIVGDLYRSLDGGLSWEGSYGVFMMFTVSTSPLLLADEGLEGLVAEPDRPPVLDSRRVTLIPVKGVGGAAELVGGLFHGQKPIATGRRPEGEEKCDDLRE